MIRALARPQTLATAVVAGLIAGSLMLTCLALMNLVILHTPGFTLAGLFVFTASALVGPVAYTSDVYVGVGVVLHFAVSIGWSIGYAALAESQRQLVTRPLLSGAAFGLVIYFAMQLVLVGAGLYRIPTPSELGVALLAHLVFFGLPVALIVGRAGRMS